MLLITIFEYKSNRDENYILSIKKYLEEVWPYLKDINISKNLIFQFKSINFISCKACNAFKE